MDPLPAVANGFPCTPDLITVPLRYVSVGNADALYGAVVQSTRFVDWGLRLHLLRVTLSQVYLPQPPCSSSSSSTNLLPRRANLGSAHLPSTPVSLGNSATRTMGAKPRQKVCSSPSFRRVDENNGTRRNVLGTFIATSLMPDVPLVRVQFYLPEIADVSSCS